MMDILLKKKKTWCGEWGRCERRTSTKPI